MSMIVSLRTPMACGAAAGPVIDFPTPQMSVRLTDAQPEIPR
jgi:hypothetical protein